MDGWTSLHKLGPDDPSELVRTGANLLGCWANRLWKCRDVSLPPVGSASLHEEHVLLDFPAFLFFFFYQLHPLLEPGESFIIQCVGWRRRETLAGIGTRTATSEAGMKGRG